MATTKKLLNRYTNVIRFATVSPNDKQNIKYLKDYCKNFDKLMDNDCTLISVVRNNHGESVGKVVYDIYKQPKKKK